MYRLTKLIFIDSYSPKKRAIVNLKGNTNLNGDNGYGKTTMLRVLPLFFGASPGQLVRRSGTNKSFVDYYLPRPTSYIIFEYERESEANLVVIFRGDSSLRFRFIKSAYSDSMFFDDSNKHTNVINSSDWAKLMKLKGLDPSQMLGVEDYRNIIQSGLTFSKSSDRKRKALINNYRTLYSFCRQGTSIQNIDLVTTAILERAPSIEAIKELLTNILTHDNAVDSEEIPTLTVKTSKLSEWISDRDAYQAMSNCEADIQELNQVKYHYDDCINIQRDLRTKAKTLLNQLFIEIESASQIKSNKEEEIETHREKIDKSKRAYLNDKSHLESKLEETGQRISSLEKNRDSFNDEGIIEKKRLVENIVNISSKKEELEGQYQALTNEQQDIENTFEKLKNKLTKDYQSRLLSFSSQENLLLEKYQNKNSSLSKEKQKKLEAEGNKYFEQHDRLQELLKEITVEQAKLETSLENTPTPPSLKKAYQVIENRLNDLNLKTADLNEKVNQAEKKLLKHRENIKLTSKEVNELSREKRQLDEQLDHLKSLKNPDKNNLLSFLRENHGSWSENIAKVTPEELLLRTDLSPEITTLQDTLYGVSLDLSVIETARAADEADLQQQMFNLNDELSDKEIQIKTLSDSTKKLTDQSKQFEVAVFEAKNTRKKHTKTITETSEQLELHQSEIEIAIAELKTDNKNKIEECIKRLKSEESRIDEHKQNYKTAKNLIHQTFKARENELEKDLKEKKKKIAQERKYVEATYKTEFNHLDKQKITALIERGVDPEFLESLTLQLKEQDKELKTAKENKPLVEQYESWLKNDWSQYEILQTKYRENNEKLHGSNETWKLLEEALKSQERKLRQAFEDSKKEYKQLEKDISSLQKMLKFFPDTGELSEDDSLLTDGIKNIQLLKNRWEKAIQQDQDLSKQGGSLYNQIRNRINVFRDSSPQKFLSRLTADFSRESTHFRNEWLFAADSLANYMRMDHQGHLTRLRSMAQLLGQDITDYYTVLSRTHKEINKLGRKVSKHSQSVISDFSVIDNLSVSVTSNLDKLEFWNALEKFSQSHQTWVARSLHELPDSDYIEKLKLVAQLFENSGINIKLSKSFDASFSVSDQGLTKTARTTKELEGISSNGLSYLIIISIYTALVNMLRGKSGAVMIWPVDELRNFSAKNTIKLMRSLEQQKVYIFSAFPDPDPELLKHYTNRYLIEKNRTLIEYPDNLPDNTNYLDTLLANEGL